jgi:hypothetical protein
VRGALSFVPGLFALQWSLGRHARPMDPASTIDLAGSSPFGRLLLALIAVGLAGYAGWGLLRAVVDPLRRGRSPGGIAQRIGYLASAVAYAGLWWATVGVLSGRVPSVAPAQEWSVAMLARPFGGFVVASIGVCWIVGSGVAQIRTGWRRTFLRDLAFERIGARERHFATVLGSIGLIARGLVFALIGVLLIATALHAANAAPGGLDGAFRTLDHRPFGRLLLGSAGAGLMCFGVYAAMCARWMRIGLRGSHAIRESRG